MKASQQAEFRRFVTARTPELFEVAYAVAGRQDRAERLLQSALERLALRWGRTTDPYAYVTQLLRRRTLPWWRRWTGTGEPPPVPEGTAGRGRPVDLGEFALSGARRRRLVRAGAVAAVPVVLAGAVVLVADGGGGGGGVDEGDDPAPTVDLAAPNVVTSYYDQGTYVLNPDTGEYDLWTQEPGVISPDLRLAARVAAYGSKVIVSPTTGGDPVQTFDPEVPVAAVTWSPDSRTLAVTPEPGTLRGYTHVLLADVDTGQIADVAIDFPPDRGGWYEVGEGAYWVDADHLAVPTVDTSVTIDLDNVPRELREVSSGWSWHWSMRMPVAITVIDRTGAVAQELPIDNDGQELGRTWTPAGLVRDGRHLLFRHADADLLEAATVDLANPSSPYPAVQVPLPELPPEDGVSDVPFPWPAAWLDDGRVVIEFFFPYPPSARSGTLASTHQMLLVNLDDGTVESCMPSAAGCDALRLGQLLGTEFPVPPTATVLSFR